MGPWLAMEDRDGDRDRRRTVRPGRVMTRWQGIWKSIFGGMGKNDAIGHAMPYWRETASTVITVQYINGAPPNHRVRDGPLDISVAPDAIPVTMRHACPSLTQFIYIFYHGLI